MRLLLIVAIPAVRPPLTVALPLTLIPLWAVIGLLATSDPPAVWVPMTVSPCASLLIVPPMPPLGVRRMSVLLFPSETLVSPCT